MAQDVTLPIIAEKIRKWFPELNGRAVAVMDDDITNTNAPDLPFAMVALNSVTTVGATDIQAAARLDLIEDVIIEFWYSPERYKKSDGSESPFWSYREYKTVMDRLIVGLKDDPEISEIAAVEFVSMNVGTTELAVMFEFRFRFTSTWCEPENCDINDNIPIEISVNILPFDSCESDGDCNGKTNCGSDCP